MRKLDKRLECVIGKKINKLTILSFEKTNGNTYAFCRCDCGGEKRIIYSNIRKGLTTSCGCHQINRIKEVCVTHGKSKSRIHKEWRSIKYRIKNKSASDYEYYGGKNISMCDEWESNFESFYEWSISNGYNDTLTIDRIDNNGNYEPSNCRWISHQKNCFNRGLFSNNTSGCAGVTFDKRTNSWRANIMVDGKNIYLGRHKNIADAIASRKKAEKDYFII
ncbi:MAG: hypothetical protein RR598_10730 [Anaerorhabdus sp.]